MKLSRKIEFFICLIYVYYIKDDGCSFIRKMTTGKICKKEKFYFHWEKIGPITYCRNLCLRKISNLEREYKSRATKQIRGRPLTDRVMNLVKLRENALIKGPLPKNIISHIIKLCEKKKNIVPIYDNKIRNLCPNKNYANGIYIRTIKTHNCVDGFHLILESTKIKTVKYLCSIGVKLDHIVIANYSSNDCEKIKKEIIKEYGYCSVDIQASSLSKYLERNNTKKFKSIWFDYTCTMEGNSLVDPKYDFSLVIEKKMLDKNGVLGFTFCIREKVSSFSEISIAEIQKKFYFSNMLENIEDSSFQRYKYQTIYMLESMASKYKNFNIESKVEFFGYKPLKFFHMNDIPVNKKSDPHCNMYCFFFYASIF